MIERLSLKPTHKAVQNYYQALREFEALGGSHEGAVRTAFQTYWKHAASNLVGNLYPNGSDATKQDPFRMDGALIDEYRLPHGFWEAKDTQDDLAKEVKKKINAGYPQNNIVFQAARSVDQIVVLKWDQEHLGIRRRTLL